MKYQGACYGAKVHCHEGILRLFGVRIRSAQLAVLLDLPQRWLASLSTSALATNLRDGLVLHQPNTPFNSYNLMTCHIRSKYSQACSA